LVNGRRVSAQRVLHVRRGITTLKDCAFEQTLNLFTRFDFGDLDTYGGGLVGHPFVKLLSLPTSAPKAATAEFKSARSSALAALPPTVNPTIFGGNEIDPSSLGSLSVAEEPSTKNLAADASGSIGSDASTIVILEDDISKLAKFIPIILGLLGANVLIVLILSIIGCVSLVRLKGRSNYQSVKTYGH